MFLTMPDLSLFRTEWSHLPILPSTTDGISCRLTTCVGCGDFFTAQRPARHICNFRTRGFPILDGDGAFLEHMQPCGVQYHAGCVRAGPPFETRLEGGKGLTMPTLPVEPSFVCELCQVRAIVGRELRCTSADIQLLCFERVRLIDFRCSWEHGTLKKYGTYLRYLDAFGSRYGARVLKPTLYAAPLPLSQSLCTGRS
jgi:hypothetical protein